MKDEQTRGAVLQWLVPVIVLIVVVIVMLFNFSAKSNREAADEIENSLIQTTEGYALKVNQELVSLVDAGKPMGFLMKEYIQEGNKAIVQMEEALFANTEAYAIVYYDDRKDGLRNDGTKAAISETKYFAQIQEAFETLDKADDSLAARYLYVEDDELGNERDAIIAAIALDGSKDGDMLLMYYPVEHMKRLFKKTEFDSDIFYALIDPEGQIIESDGSESPFTAGTNLWDAVKQNPAYNKDELVKSTVRMKNRSAGTLEARVGSESRVLVYAPVGINGWSLVIGINQDYVENLKNKEWSNTKLMIYQLVAAMLIFFALVIVLNILNRIRSSEKNKELEEKADTDQLTSLYNKLATERKIKEYMSQHPNEQGLMFVLDIDNFKKINDTLGHAFGDEVLRTLGHQMGAVFRASDVVGRTGGDEFTIFLKGLNEDVLLEKEAMKLCNFFKNFQAGEYVKYAATASIGAAVFPRDGKDFETLYKAADHALYTAKKRGKSQLAFYGEDENKSEGKKKVEAESRARESQN